MPSKIPPLPRQILSTKFFCFLVRHRLGGVGQTPINKNKTNLCMILITVLCKNRKIGFKSSWIDKELKKKPHNFNIYLETM